jgi:hypothetical protein
MGYFGGLLCAALVVFTAAAAAAESPVGTIKAVAGAVFVVRQGTASSPQPNEKVFRGDAFKTGADGSLGIMFVDDTSLSLGPNTHIIVEEFLFTPAKGELGFVARILRGTAAYLSGIIGKLSPESVRIETPVAVVGIRGTRLLVKIDDDGG